MTTQKPQHLNRNIGIVVGAITVLLLTLIAGYYIGSNNNSISPSPTPTSTITPTDAPFPTPTPFPTVTTVITSVSFNGTTYSMGTGGQSESIPDVSMPLNANYSLVVTVTDHETNNPSSVPEMHGFDDSTSGENGIISFMPSYGLVAGTSIESATTSGINCILTFNVHSMAVGVANPVINIMPSNYGYNFQNATLSFRVTVYS